ncbi:MAG TPA: DUF2085 domain-containing protein [Verrucomicrobiae bacterium]|nr:DUF2085 domain-containing protein [Verrucomicrobiae bacterium]
MFLAIPLTALAFSELAPSFGHSLFSPVCHQGPERSLGSLPLCSRCLGLYLGFGLAGFLVPAFSLRFSLKFIVVGLALSFVLAVLSFFFPIADGNYLRLILGLSVGAGLASLVKSILK